MRRLSRDRWMPHHRAILVLAGLGVALGLLTMSACNAGFEGAKPVLPAVVSQPANQSVTVGQTATFSVTATGTGPLAFQWYDNGVAISGATSSNYTTPPTTLANNGSVFTVTVTNLAGTVTSMGATLTVTTIAPVAKSLVPSNSTPTYNTSVNLFPTFSGGTAVIGSTGVGSSDVTASAVSGGSYPTPLLTSTKTYTLTVTDAYGNVVSTTCVVTPTMVTITPISPPNQTVAPGQITFTATASGGATNGLTWSATGGSFSGNVWTAPTVAGTYTITATSTDEPSVSVSTTITISAPAIVTQPASQHVCTGGVLTLTVVASYATSYQWNLNSAPIPGATNSTYTVAAAASADAGNYAVTVTNGVTSQTSNVAVVAVGSSITSNPMSVSVHPTETASFSVAAQGLGPFTYQWYQIPSGGGTGVAISGAASSSYTTPPVDLTYDGAQYYATVTDSCGTPITSTSATLTVTAGNASPIIITQPAGQSAAPGSTPSFTVVATGTPTLTYQWYVIPAGQTTGTAVSGATSATYTLPSTATTVANDQDSYYVIVTNAYGQAVSQPATLAVGSGILITQQPVTQYVDVGATATFQVSATSALPLIYQWYEAAPGSSTFTAIAGATSASYTTDPTATTDNGSVFYVVVSNGTTASVTSSSAGLFVGALSGIPPCDTSWSTIGTAIAEPGCSFQLTAATYDQAGEIVWPNLISTDDIQLSFTMTLSNPSAVPADGFTMVLGDPTLGATLTSTGAPGMGLGAEGIPGTVIGFDTYHNAGDPPVPYLGVGSGEGAKFENPWYSVDTSIPTLVAVGMSISHDYTISIVQGQMNVTMDGVQIMSGSITVPPVAYLYVTASTGGSYEQAVISNVVATVSVPPN